jgi:hypothetical protein
LDKPRRLMGNVAACCASDGAANAPLSPGPPRSGSAAESPAPSTAEPGISSRPAAQWDVAEVEAWVLAIGMPPEVAGAFRDADIEGHELLALTRDELGQDVGVQKIGHKKRIMAALEDLKAQAGGSGARGGAADAAGGGRGGGGGGGSGAAAALGGLLHGAGTPAQLAQLGGAAGGFASKLQAQIPADLSKHQGGRAALSSALGSIGGALGAKGLPPEETSPVTRTKQGFGLSVMESAPSRDDAVVVEGGFCRAVPVGSTVVRVNGAAVRSVDDIRTALGNVPVGGTAEIGYRSPSSAAAG